MFLSILFVLFQDNSLSVFICLVSYFTHDFVVRPFGADEEMYSNPSILMRLLFLDYFQALIEDILMVYTKNKEKKKMRLTRFHL